MGVVVIVKNINGAAGSDCGCGSWLDHWKKFSQQSLPAYCPQMACANPPETAAHVQKDDDADRAWYIVPLCAAHNAKTGEAIEVLSRIVLVPANASTACGND